MGGVHGRRGLRLRQPAGGPGQHLHLTNEIPYDEETGTQDEAALAEIREQEISTAVADRTCQDSTGAGRAALEAQFAIEQDFIDAHKDELDAMVEKAAQASK